MKVAIIHDWLNEKVGGAENVLFELARMYPQADIYTLVYNPKKFAPYLGGRNIRTSRLQKFPWFIRSRPKLLLPFIKGAVEALDLGGYDLVISSSSAWVKNVNVGKGTKHICYCYSPARMMWDSWPGYIKHMKTGPVVRFYIIRLVSKLRLWDFNMSQLNTKFIAISQHVQKRIEKFYAKPSKVIYPPVHTDRFKGKAKKSDYFLIVSVLSEYKQIDLAIKAFIKNRATLKIAGDGPDMGRLRKIAEGQDNIEFVGRVDEATKTDLLKRARGFVFCSVEDFGITMVESIAAGTAVLALRGGGAEEIVHEGSTGFFFNQATPDSLNEALHSFNRKFKGDYVINNDYVFDKFSVKTFERKFREAVNG